MLTPSTTMSDISIPMTTTTTVVTTPTASFLTSLIASTAAAAAATITSNSSVTVALQPLMQPAPPHMVAETRMRLRRVHGAEGVGYRLISIRSQLVKEEESTYSSHSNNILRIPLINKHPTTAATSTSTAPPFQPAASPYRFSIPPPRPPQPHSTTAAASNHTAPVAPPSSQQLISQINSAAPTRIYNKAVFSDDDEDEEEDDDDENDHHDDMSNRIGSPPPTSSSSSHYGDHHPPSPSRHRHPLELSDVDDEKERNPDAHSSEEEDEHSDAGAREEEMEEEEHNQQPMDEDDPDHESKTTSTSTSLTGQKRKTYPGRPKAGSLQAALQQPVNKGGVQHFQAYVEQKRPGVNFLDLELEELIGLIPDWILTARTLTGGFYRFDSTFMGYIRSIQRVVRLKEPHWIWSNVNLLHEPAIAAAVEQMRDLIRIHSNEPGAEPSSSSSSQPATTSANRSLEMTTRWSEKHATHGGGGGTNSAPSSPPTSPRQESIRPDLLNPNVALRPVNKAFFTTLTLDQEVFLTSQLDPEHPGGLLRLNFMNVIRYFGATSTEEHRNLSLRNFVYGRKVVSVKYENGFQPPLLSKTQLDSLDADSAGVIHASPSNIPFEVCDPSELGCVLRSVRFILFLPGAGSRRKRGFMYERPWEGRLCPIALWLAYLRRRPPVIPTGTPSVPKADIEASTLLWLQAKRRITEFDQEWYLNSIFGKTKCSQLVGSVAANCGLDGIFVNSSLRYRPAYCLTLTTEEVENLKAENRANNYYVQDRARALLMELPQPPPTSIMPPSQPKQLPPQLQQPHQQPPPSHLSNGPTSMQLPPASFYQQIPPAPAGSQHPYFQPPMRQQPPPAQPFQPLQLPSPFSYLLPPSTFLQTEPPFMDQYRQTQWYTQLEESLRQKKLAQDPPVTTADEDATKEPILVPAPRLVTSDEDGSAVSTTLVPANLESIASLTTFLDKFQSEITTLTTYAASCQKSLDSFRSMTATLKAETRASLKCLQQQTKIAEQFQLIEEQKFQIEELRKEKEALMAAANSGGKSDTTATDSTSFASISQQLQALFPLSTLPPPPQSSPDTSLPHGSPGKSAPAPPGSGLSCHHCRMRKTVDQLYFCTNPSNPEFAGGGTKRPCQKKVCIKCAQRHYHSFIPTTDEMKQAFICPHCSGACLSSRCVESKAKRWTKMNGPTQNEQPTSTPTNHQPQPMEIDANGVTTTTALNGVASSSTPNGPTGSIMDEQKEVDDPMDEDDDNDDDLYDDGGLYSDGEDYQPVMVELADDDLPPLVDPKTTSPKTPQLNPISSATAVTPPATHAAENATTPPQSASKAMQLISKFADSPSRILGEKDRSTPSQS